MRGEGGGLCSALYSRPSDIVFNSRNNSTTTSKALDHPWLQLKGLVSWLQISSLQSLVINVPHCATATIGNCMNLWCWYYS